MLKTASASTQLRLKSPKKNRQKMFYIYTASKISKRTVLRDNYTVLQKLEFYAQYGNCVYAAEVKNPF